MGMPGSESVPSGDGKQNPVERAMTKIKYSKKNASTFVANVLKTSDAAYISGALILRSVGR